MFTLFRLIPVREALTAQIPVLVAAFAVAELFYKFGSFMLECLAFLATWFALDLVVHLVRREVGLAADTVDSGS